MQEEYVILVDEQDNEIGLAEKWSAHKHAQLHRAFSVFILRETPTGLQTLLQRRQDDKYHCARLWTNSCCSHPRQFESNMAAAKRRLQEEMGLQTDLEEIGQFTYMAKFSNGLTEHELDHVFIGWLDTENCPFNLLEVQATRWMNLIELRADLQNQPELYTPWLGLALNLVEQHLNKANNFYN